MADNIPVASRRDIDKNPYTKDEARVAAFFCARGLGAGDDPIGSLLASYAYVVQKRNQYFQEVLQLRSTLRQVTRQSPSGGSSNGRG